MNDSWLDSTTIVVLHDRLVREHGGVIGIRDSGALEACCAAPFQQFDGMDLYPGVAAKSARLAFEIITQHPFVDGNKRTGIAAMLALYRVLSGNEMAVTSEQLVELANNVASGRTGYPQLFDFVRRHGPKKHHGWLAGGG